MDKALAQISNENNEIFQEQTGKVVSKESLTKIEKRHKEMTRNSSEKHAQFEQRGPPVFSGWVVGVGEPYSTPFGRNQTLKICIQQFRSDPNYSGETESFRYEDDNKKLVLKVQQPEKKDDPSKDFEAEIPLEETLEVQGIYTMSAKEHIIHGIVPGMFVTVYNLKSKGSYPKKDSVPKREDFKSKNSFLNFTSVDKSKIFPTKTLFEIVKTKKDFFNSFICYDPHQGFQNSSLLLRVLKNDLEFIGEFKPCVLTPYYSSIKSTNNIKPEFYEFEDKEKQKKIKYETTLAFTQVNFYDPKKQVVEKEEKDASEQIFEGKLFLYDGCLSCFQIFSHEHWVTLAPFIFKNLEYFVVANLNNEKSLRLTSETVGAIPFTANGFIMYADIPSVYKTIGVPVTKKHAIFSDRDRSLPITKSTDFVSVSSDSKYKTSYLENRKDVSYVAITPINDIQKAKYFKKLSVNPEEGDYLIDLLSGDEDKLLEIENLEEEERSEFQEFVLEMKRRFIGKFIYQVFALIPLDPDFEKDCRQRALDLVTHLQGMIKYDYWACMTRKRHFFEKNENKNNGELPAPPSLPQLEAPKDSVLVEEVKEISQGQEPLTGEEPEFDLEIDESALENENTLGDLELVTEKEEPKPKEKKPNKRKATMPHSTKKRKNDTQ